jgi:hypothetical protein
MTEKRDGVRNGAGRELGMDTLTLRSEGVAWTDVDGEVVALDEDAAMYLAANEAGALLWRALAVGATRESLAQMLAAEYGLAREQAQADTDAFITALRERGLLAG